MLEGFLRPKPTISEEEIKKGLHYLTLEGMTSLGFFSITTSGFLAAFALALGANNFQIGILAAIPFITQLLQIPAIALVERFRMRKLLAISTWIPSQLCWLPMALIPLFMDIPSNAAIIVLMGLLALRGIFGALCNCAWNSWIRDLIPQQILGSTMGHRLASAAFVGMVFGLGAAFFADWWKGYVPTDSQIYGYTIPMLFGICTLALASPIFMLLIPEPLMQPPPKPKPSLASTISEPFRDKNYRNLLRFLFFWGFAINLATPFFAIYMLQRLGLPLSSVIGLSILSQAFNIMFLRVWGRLTDQFGIKAVLSVCVSLYILVILGWTFTTMPEKYFLTIPLLILLHVLAGIAAAGVTLSTGIISMKLAPSGRATSYLACAGLAINLGAGIGPILGGYFADYFSGRQLSFNLEWTDLNQVFHIGSLSYTGFDLLFGLSFIIGLITLTLLAGVREEGEVEREVVLDALHAPMRALSRPFSTAASLNFLSHFPYAYLRRVPVPGVDAVLGVTEYQIAEMSRLATIIKHKSKSTTTRLAKVLEESLTGIHEVGNHLRSIYGLEISKHAARGAIHATDKTSKTDIGHMARHAVIDVTEAMQQFRIESKHILRGIGHGVVQGADEVNADVGKAAKEAVQAAKEVASQIGVSEEEAKAHTSQGAIDAAMSIGPDAAHRVKETLAELDSNKPNSIAHEELKNSQS